MVLKKSCLGPQHLRVCHVDVVFYVVCNSNEVYSNNQDLPDDTLLWYGDVETATPKILLTITHVVIFMLACERVHMCVVNTRASCQSDVVEEGIL